MRKSRHLIVVVGGTGTILVDSGATESFLLRLSVGIEVRSLSMRSRAHSMATVGEEAIASRVVLKKTVSLCLDERRGLVTYHRAVIPEDNCARSPLDSRLELGAASDDLIKICLDGIALQLGHTLDRNHEPRVVVDGLEPGNRVDTNKWVFGDHRFTTNRTTRSARTLGLFLGGVEGGKAFKVLLVAGRQKIVHCILVGEKGVSSTATRRAFEDL